MPHLVKKRIQKAREAARELHVVFGRDNSYEVVFENTKVNVVDLRKKECDCGEWQVSGLSCKHVVCCIDTERFNVEKFIDPLLKKDACLRTYKEQLNPLLEEIIWPLVHHNDLQPPEVKKQVGRPKVARKRAVNEPQPMKRSCSVRCIVCSEWGHNKRTCVKAKFPNQRPHPKAEHVNS